MTKSTPGQRLVKINLRIPLDLRNKLKQIAAREGRSMNSQAVQMLQEQVKKVA